MPIVYLMKYSVIKILRNTFQENRITLPNDRKNISNPIGKTLEHHNIQIPGKNFQMVECLYTTMGS